MAMRKRVPRGGFVPEESGEEMVEICLRKEDCQRLRGWKGEWFEGFFYEAYPGATYTVKVRVPRSALEGFVFFPGRCNDLAAVAKSCREVPPPRGKK